MEHNRFFLVLWQTGSAESWVGLTPSSSVGSHMKGLNKGDRIVVAACDDTELYLLGAMLVSSRSTERGGPYRGKPSVKGKTLAGAFQMLPLGDVKWRLRFESKEAPRLLKSKSLLWQVRSRRQLTPTSAELLLSTLTRQRSLEAKISQQFKREGRLLMRMVTARERDPQVRAAALKKYGFKCQICDISPGDRYGEMAKECLDVHHLRPLASRDSIRQRTTLQDVILLCPTCHRALHMSENPADWMRFRV
jgi:hypothetical protein